MYFYIDLARARLAGEAMQDLALGTLAAQGSPKAIKSQMRDLKRNSR